MLNSLMHILMHKYRGIYEFYTCRCMNLIIAFFLNMSRLNTGTK